MVLSLEEERLVWCHNGHSVLVSVAGRMTLVAAEAKLPLVSDSLHLWPMNSLHLCPLSHFVHVSIMPTRERLMTEAG